ncbi:large ribosomal subunit protein uL1-like [Halichondria panicea]|uniref:large ribosomal subunit protein uL1-like n=1 Tax=Halichondria panicea TaxID=6063 RepID=UPI00312BC256
MALLRKLCSTRALASTVMRAASSQPQQSSPPIQATASRIFQLGKRDPEILDFPEALRALRAYSMSQVPETVELSIKLDMTLKRGKSRDSFRGALIYPHRFGTQSKILLLAEGAEGLSTGADIVGGEELIKKLDSNDPGLEFDVCLCTLEMYLKIKHLQKKLRTKMPNPRRGTVIELKEAAKNVLKFQQSRDFKCDKHGYVNMPVGKLDFSDASLSENAECLVGTVAAYKQHLPKASFIVRVVVSTTYGPGFLLNLNQFI